MKYYNPAFVGPIKLNQQSLYAKLTKYAPDEKLSAKDIATIMFILRFFNDELACIDFKKEVFNEHRRKHS